MVASDGFAEFLREQLAPLGRVTMRRMFGKTGVFCDGLMLGMVTGNLEWGRLERPDAAEAFEAMQAEAQWAEDHASGWFSVLDHMIQIPRVGAPDEPFLEGWAVLSALAAVTTHIRLATLCTAVGYR